MLPQRHFITVAVALRLSEGARVHQDARVALQQGLQAKAETKLGCPAEGEGFVRESDAGDCIGPTGEPLLYFCCNQLRACRSDSTELLQYYQEWQNTYEASCDVSNKDFDLTIDGQNLRFVGDAQKMCEPACQTTRSIQQKPPAPHRARDLKEMCDGKVAKDYWGPQLDSLVWPEDKVKSLDAAWTACGQHTFPEPTTPPIRTPSTTMTTTVTFTADTDRGVDFGFMTSDRTPVEGKRGVVHWFNKNILRRRQRNMDNFEEISGGHTCRAKGTREQTYYASSLCYWLPDIQKDTTPNPVGLSWSGGAEGDASLCTMSVGDGKCVKCSICHNNGMSEDGSVNYTAFPEEIALPACKKETEIETLCVNDYHINNEGLKKENDRCTIVKKEFDHADAAYNQAVALLQELNRLVDNELPEKIADKEKVIQDETARMAAARVNETKGRMDIKSEDGCAGYNRCCVSAFWYYNADKIDEYPTGDLLLDIGHLHCGTNMECRRCREVVARVQEAYDVVTEAEEKKELAEKHMKMLQAELTAKTAERQHWQEQEPILKADRDAKSATWTPQEAGCMTTFEEYTSKRSTYIKDCAPTYYDQSCEKACIEISSTRSEGCGVMEGTSASDSRMFAGRGGLSNRCNPPQPSWIYGPWTYNASEEDGFRQCNRIWDLQKPKYAQKILKSGWLYKSGRFGGSWFGLHKYSWEKRYFVLEGGDQVRSGIMRYWLSDPQVGAGRAVERYKKFIILWDAQSTAAKRGRTYRRGADECFELKHFYRTYRFCLSAQDYQGKDLAKERDQWMQLVQGEIKNLGRGS